MTFRKETNKIVIEYLKDKDGTFRIEDNVHHAKNAFVIRSIIAWGLQKYDEDERGGTQLLNSCISMVERYLNDEVDITWQDDTILVKDKRV